METMHFVKSVQIRSFSGSYFPLLGLNTEIYGVNIRIKSKYGSEKTPYLDIFRVVRMSIWVM